MTWHDEVIEQLAAQPIGGYRRGQSAACEPTALAAMALATVGQTKAAHEAASWLADRQQADGAIGINAQQDSPRWPTSLAILAWTAVDPQLHEFTANVEQAVETLLSIEGKPTPRSADIGHDTTLIGWPWVDGTHSWLEPTAFAVLALKRAGMADHPRTREAVRVLIDRQFVDGGCNYGNTIVLGQRLEPHVQPTAIVLLSVLDELPSARIASSVAWLEEQWTEISGLASRCFAAMALTAHGRRPDNCFERLAAEHGRLAKGAASVYQRALLALAALEAPGPLAADFSMERSS